MSEMNVAPMTDAVANLGANLHALATTPESRDCLRVFAELLSQPGGSSFSQLLAVLAEPAGGVEILTIGNANPGLTVQVDEDVRFSAPQLWFGENPRY